MARKKPDGPVGVAVPPDPPPDKRVHNRKGRYVIQRRIEVTRLDTNAPSGPRVEPKAPQAWIDGTTFESKTVADKALADLATAGVFRVAQVYPAVKLVVEDRPVVTSRKPV